SATTAEYYHLMFEDHEIVFSNGMPTESILAGAMTATPGAAAAEYEFKQIFGAKARLNINAKPVAFPVMKRYEAQVLQGL
ncbi:MAG: Hint domain-containing protein, partial [Marinosulfonomonas sp.]|nr:Hint domain-containing protein [Marinosulfonomonas sp.]